MIGFISDLAHKIGMDKAIAYSSGSRIVQGFTGVISVFFITTFLTGVEQGFYYTFGSILAMQVFFELGLTGIMTQFVAHEASHLILYEKSEYEGEERYKSRLASLIHFCVKWYTVLGGVVLLFLMIVGHFYFKRYGGSHVEVNWQIPWILICIATAIKLFQAPFTSIFMGLGMVKEMSKIGFWQQIILPSVSWLSLACGFKLYVLGIGYLASVFLWICFIWKMGMARIIINLWKIKMSERVSYFKEIFPFQWKIALSWVSGYFIFQLFNPVLFATEGAVVAGQMGMTLQALNAIQSFSFSWLNTKVPLYSKLIALKNYVELDTIFIKSTKQMVRVCLFLLLFFLLFVWILNISHLRIGHNVLAERFLPFIPTLLLMVTVYLQQYTNSWATYLRCHKQEPFLLPSVCGAVADASSTIVLGKLFGLYGIVIGYTVICVLFFPWGYWIYRTKKEVWHRV